jgi:steroid delta-isomerase-like uncharacterized protein
MSAENKQLVTGKVQELWSTGNTAILDEIIAPGYTLHKPPTGFSPDLAGLKQILTPMRSAFPDLKVTVQDVIAEGDKVVQRRTFEGTHKGAFFGIPPTGKSVSVSQIIVSKVAGGKIVEEWAETDFLGMLQQVGAAPSMG